MGVRGLDKDEGRMMRRWKEEQVKDVKGQGVPCLSISKPLPCQ